MKQESNLPFCYLKGIQNHNDSMDKLFNPELDKATLITSIAISIFVLLSNSMLIYGLYRTTKRPMSTTKKLFIYLSCTDLLTTLSGQTRHILSYYIKNCIVLLLLNSASNSFFCLGITIFFTISILRYLSLRNPFNSVGNRRMNFILLVEIVFSILIGFSNIFLINVNAERFIIFMHVFVSITYFMVVLSLLVLNLLSYITLRSNIKRGVTTTSDNNGSRNSNSQSTHDETVNDSGNQSMKNKRKRNAVNTLIVISIFYLLCNLPTCIFFFVATGSSFQADYIFSNFVRDYQISILLLFVSVSNNGFNAAILIVRSKDILSFYKSMILCCCLLYTSPSPRDS